MRRHASLPAVLAVLVLAALACDGKGGKITLALA